MARYGAVGAVVAFGTWSLGALKYSREFGEVSPGYDLIGVALVVAGGAFAGIFFGFSPKALSERRPRRFARWCLIMAIAMVPTAAAELLHNPSWMTGVWTAVISVGLAFTTWFIEDRLIRDE